MLSITNNLEDVPAAPQGPFPLGPGVGSFPLPGELNVELRQDAFAQLQVAGSSGCLGVNAASVDLVGLHFPPNATGTFGVHDATRSVPDVTGTFNTDSNGGFDTGSLPINAQTGDRIEAGASVGSVGAYGLVDPIQYCIG